MRWQKERLDAVENRLAGTIPVKHCLTLKAAALSMLSRNTV